MATLAPGTVIAGKYRLDRPLARGGMGSVWVAEHLQLAAPVAVKFMDPSFAQSADARARFEREARACARLRSPHIIQVHDYGIEGNTPYIVMELLEGEELGARLRGGRRLAPAVLAPIALQIGKALRAAHEAGVVHRDLKPANIFLCRDHDEEMVKILDFGVAKAVGEAQVTEATATGMVIGSPQYMSPEQIRAARDITPLSDVWSFGVILFRAVVGRLPFLDTQVSSVLVAICSDPIPAPSALAPDLGPEVDGFFARALARDPAQRFQSAREMAEAFAALAGTPVTGAHPVPPATLTGSAAAMTGVRSLEASGTLSPSGQSVALPPAPRAAAVVAALGGLALLVAAGVVGLALALRAPETPSAAAGVATTAPPATAEVPPAVTTAPLPTASATPPDEVPTATAAATASARAPQVKGPLPKKSGSKRDPKFGF